MPSRVARSARGKARPSRASKANKLRLRSADEDGEGEEGEGEGALFETVLRGVLLEVIQIFLWLGLHYELESRSRSGTTSAPWGLRSREG